VSAGAVDTPERAAIVDESGPESYAELDERSDALACGLLDAGIEPGQSIAVQCRNHRLFVESIVALAKIGADALLLNTSFSGPQVADVLEREGAIALIADADMEQPKTKALLETNRFVGWRDDEPATGPRSVTALIEAGRGRRPPPPPQPGRQIILTSGTTGKPKGARRGSATGLDPLVAFLSRVPLRAGETTVIAPPLFHAWGFAHLTLGLLLGSTMVVRRRFDAAATLADAAVHRATTMVVVPVMLQRILALPEITRSVDTSSLRVVAVSGSALPGALATEFMDAYGDVVYNLYGSTEVAWAAVATPPDLRLVPGAAGRPPRGTIVKLLDDNGIEVAPGETGTIFVGSSLGFEGYTDGDDKNRLGGLISSGDLGHWDWSGQLIVEGREDDMVVSGGENVFPQEVEDVLTAHDQIADVAVVGVPDEKFGAALEAWVVKAGSSSLTEEAVRKYVKSNLASYKVPRSVRFVDELPRNATGKVLKRELTKEDALHARAAEPSQG
jgi:fatty-acyl-CoA synthase